MIFGKPENWDDSKAECSSIEVRAVVLQPEGIPVVETAWKPTAEELEQLNHGSAVVLRVYGDGMPPVQLYVEP